MGDMSNKKDLGANQEETKKFDWKRLLKVFAIFKLKVPLWAVAAVAIFFFGFWGYNTVTTDDPVNLRPIVTDSKQTDVTITMCNERVDDLDLNVRQEELRLQKRLERIENAEEARVSIKRENCITNPSE